MDIVNISDAGGILEGEGFISLSNAAILFGLQKNQILRDVIDAGGAVYGELTGETGWRVNDPALLDRDYDNSIILNDVPNHGDMVVIKQALELANASAVPRKYEKHPKLIWPEFIVPSQSHHRIFLVDDHPLTDQTLLFARSDLARLRARLLVGIGQEDIASARAARGAPAPLSSGTTVAASGKIISDLAEDYIRHHQLSGGWSRKNEQAQTIRRAVGYFTGLQGDLTLDRITADLLLEFRQQLTTMPDNMTMARKRHGDVSLARMIELVATNGEARASEHNVGLTMQRIATLLKWAVQHDIITKNPADRLVKRSRNMKKASKARLRFSDADLEQLFNFEWFKTGRGRRADSTGMHHSFKPFHYWMPLLAYYTGARCGELCQLHLSDIMQTADGLPFINITTDMDANDSGHPDESMGPKSLKNLDSEREMPLHPELVRLGLLDYVDRLRAEGFRRLFPELKYWPKGDKRYTADVIKKFSEQKVSLDLGSDADRKAFHSYRHTFSDSICRTREKLFEDVQLLMGHSLGQGQLKKTYFKGKQAVELMPVLMLLPKLKMDICPFDIDDGLEAVYAAFARRKN